MSAGVAGLAGGILIGLAATLLLALNGRIAGISGIVNGVVPGMPGDRGWRLAFLAGLMGAGALILHVGGGPSAPAAPLAQVVVAGLLVGFGTTMGNGCTSGHGVCGIARLSRRSIVAVLVFMASAIATVALVRHVFGVAA